MEIRVKNSLLHGKGVFAKRGFNKGELIEKCPVIAFSKDELKELDKTVFYNYYFSWKNGGAIALGLGSLYNHSYRPNAIYLKDFKRGFITFRALKTIKKNEEILVNYNGKPSSRAKVWFEKV
jgi:SET domain-containing protein